MLKLKITLFQFFFVFISLHSFYAAEYNYAVTEIPAELLENADAVVRLDEGYFQVLSPGKAVYKTKFAITILNKNGDEHSGFIDFYDKNDKITQLSAKLFNALGKCTRTYSTKDFDDMSAASGYSLFIDNRLKRLKPVATEYPYTIEYVCEKIYEGLLFYPTWTYTPDYRISMQYSKFIVEVPESLGLRYRQLNYDSIPKTFHTAQKIIYTWECSNLNAFNNEPFGPPLSKISPLIILGANDFVMEGYQGSMKDWNGLGNWVNNLNYGLDELSDETIEKIRNIVKDCKSDYDRIKTLYNYLQKKARYVNITIGIGGWKPFPARVVDEVSYGDCKALSNYMVAILKLVGIKADYVLVKAGNYATDIIEDFPYQQFNHAIVRVVTGNDTIWLECTDPFIPFGYLGKFTDERHALVIKDTGGEIIKTPTYPKDSNLLVYSSIVYIDTEGYANAEQKLVYKSIFYDDAQEFLIESNDQQKRWLYDNIEIPNFKIISFSSNQYGDRFPTAIINQNIELPAYATKTGNRLFVPLKMMDRDGYVPRKLNDRKTDIYIRRGYVRIDTIKYMLPEGYRIEYKPDDFIVESVFGSCSSRVIESGDGILYIRKSETNKGIFPKAEYNNMIDYYKQIARADKAQLVLVKQ